MQSGVVHGFHWLGWRLIPRVQGRLWRTLENDSVFWVKRVLIWHPGNVLDDLLGGHGLVLELLCKEVWAELLLDTPHAPILQRESLVTTLESFHHFAASCATDWKLVSQNAEAVGWAADNAGGAPADLDWVWACSADNCGGRMPDMRAFMLAA